MKFKKAILAVFLMQLITGVLCPQVFAVYPGTFDYKNEGAYIVYKKKPDNEIVLYVDFKNKIKKIIKKSRVFRFLAVNKNRTILSFASIDKLYFYDIEKEKEIFTVPIKSGRKITWNSSGEKISYYDSSNHVIMEIDIKNREIIKIPFNGIIFQTRWSEVSNGFLYQLLNKEPDDDVGHMDAKIMRVVDGKLQVYGEVKTLTLSPDGKYYYEGKTYLEEGNVVSFYKADGEKIISYFDASIPLFNANPLWGKDTVRFLSQGGVFDFKAGKFITYTHNFWPEEGPRPKKINPRRDVAADWNNYVLMWNKDTKIFEVEDINTGKIIKTYKKFW